MTPCCVLCCVLGSCCPPDDLRPEVVLRSGLEGAL
jgi:hypothetical protein